MIDMIPLYRMRWQKNQTASLICLISSTRWKTYITPTQPGIKPTQQPSTPKWDICTRKGERLDFKSEFTSFWKNSVKHGKELISHLPPSSAFYCCWYGESKGDISSFSLGSGVLLLPQGRLLNENIMSCWIKIETHQYLTPLTAHGNCFFIVVCMGREKMASPDSVWGLRNQPWHGQCAKINCQS